MAYSLRALTPLQSEAENEKDGFAISRNRCCGITKSSSSTTCRRSTEVVLRGGFQPLCTCAGMACPEEAARREYLRRLGFFANRPYSPSSALAAEAAAWSDIQSFPFPFNIRGASNDYKYDGINDWEEPRVRAELREAMASVTAGPRVGSLRTCWCAAWQRTRDRY